MSETLKATQATSPIMTGTPTVEPIETMIPVTLEPEVEYIPVERIEVSHEEVNLYIGEIITVNVTVYPENATNKEIQWRSSIP